MGEDLQNYRLVSVVSHFGSSPNSGHYVSDVYDFQRQAWLLYSDVQVFESSDPSIQENRLNSGYIFFYMRNEGGNSLESTTLLFIYYISGIACV